MARDLVEKPNGDIVHRVSQKVFAGKALRDMDVGDKLQDKDGKTLTVKEKRIDPETGFLMVRALVEEV